MGLNVAVFVPEGIVLSSDSLAFLRQDDEGFEASSKRTFAVWNKFIVSFVGGGFITGKPYGCYMQEIESKRMSIQIDCVKDFVGYLSNFFKHIRNEDEEPLTIYVAGSSVEDSGVHHELYLTDRDSIIRLNKSNGIDDVYNYHIIGRGLWINKLVLPTTFEDNQSKLKESLEAAKIDFSKYSLDDAAKFAHFLIRTTAEMDKIIQTRAIVNLNVTTGTVTAQGTTIKDYDL